MPGRPPTAMLRLDEYGIDAVCEAFLNGWTFGGIAQEVGVDHASLRSWIASDTLRSVRVREARVLAAQHWDEAAEIAIQKALDPLSLAKAKELAFHYRWRASKIAPKEYGDKIEHTGAGGGPLAFVLLGVSEAPTSDEWLKQQD